MPRRRRSLEYITSAEGLVCAVIVPIHEYNALMEGDLHAGEVRERIQTLERDVERVERRAKPAT